ncbi:dicarboxylate/amino acid:cation symporter [Streptomyces armeniacus]|uniref:Dicarboxylate/amino acid:cation symporter n=1 Tax=Streptomyces armeniacus TaxID=83291 RepID=A0A345XWA4_9ACTN|nr:dicarboxylate/amino acid:cation symporter [Streptomyces armeniacus]AXK35920.1 dicarboxylate/amino acid:cation symporter [Streptomyces armeniacus]
MSTETREPPRTARKRFRLQLHTQVVIGAALGIVVGLILQDDASHLDPVGQIFLQLLQFLVVPLVVVTLLAGMIQMTSARDLAGIGGRFFAYLVVTSLCASAIGVGIALIVRPGRGFDVGSVEKGTPEEATGEFSFLDQIQEWVPSNIVASMAEMSMVQIIVGVILFGSAILLIGEQKIPGIYALIRESSEVVLRLTGIIIKASPYGIFALMAVLVGTTGTDSLSAAVKFIVVDYLALIVMALVVYPLVIGLVARLNVFRFYRKVWPASLFAMTTASSAATIPVSMKIAQNDLGAPKRIFGFTIPFGATANMDGFAVALGVIAVFAADAHGMDITPALILQIVLLGLVMSVGAAGVRGAGIVMSAVLLKSLGLPLEIVPLLAAIWPILDIGHTGLNVTGDLTGTATVSAADKSLEKEVFNAPPTELDTRKDKAPEAPAADQRAAP